MSAAPFPSLFAESSAWQVFASGQAEGRVSSNDTDGLRLNYDFHGGGGFIAIRRELSFLLPPTFRIRFRLRGDGPPNHFECKVAAPGGADVWRHLRQDFTPPQTWKPLDIRERDLPFAWGPSGGGAPGDVAAVEFVIAAGPGGSGWIELSDAELIDETPPDTARVSCSSQADGFSCGDAFHGSRSGWRADENDNEPWWLVDFGRAQRFGGLVIGWPEEPRSRRYVIESSDDGETWATVHECTDARDSRSFIAAPGGEARMLRVRFANAAQAAIRSLRLEPDAFSSTPNEFLHHVAEEFPRGWLARYWHREQSYWTPVGSPEGRRRALINEEGMVEVDEGGFSLEPFLTTDGALVTWADVETEASLASGGLPVPALRWRNKLLRLDILPWVDGSGETLTLHVTYRLRRLRAKGALRLFVAARPWQVNPPWQAFRNLGGRSDVRSIECHPSGLRVEGREVVATPPPAARGAATFEQGGVLPWIARGTVPDEPRAIDTNGLASAAMAWELPADERSLEVTVSVPYFSRIHSPTRRSRANALARWRRTLGKVEWQVPPAVEKAVETFRTAAGHILIHRDGPAIQPGPRRYTRSWVRDCVIMGAALAKAGMPKPLREFLVWYAGFQRDDGFVPCVVDRDGVDWLVEHDSHGQFLWGVREMQRGGANAKDIGELMPAVRKAVEYLIRLRADHAAETEPASPFHGLLPESASHEGYLAHPVHSYWDDFWGIRGLEAAADLVEPWGDAESARHWREEARRFQADVIRSMETVIASKKLDTLPGSVEWADFDPTATSNAIAQLDFADSLPARELEKSLATYLDGHHRKHDGRMVWNNYTAYEIRIIGAFVRLGKRRDANELLAFFLGDQRPGAWNQWPEITWRDPRSPGHLGDVPHTWIAAEYLLAFASMFASEREARDRLVLAAGVPWEWVAAENDMAVRGLPTRFGTLDLRMAAIGNDTLEIEIGGAITIPDDGLFIEPPVPENHIIASAGEGLEAAGDGSFRIRSLPCRADVRFAMET